MTKAIIKPTGISPFLSPAEKEYVAGYKGEKLQDLNESESLRQLLIIVNTAYAEMGTYLPGTRQSDKTEYLRMLSNLIRNDLNYYFPEVTIQEVTIAVKKGIRKHYGEYYTFSVVTVHNFVERYLESDERQQALARQIRYQLEQDVPEQPPLQNQWEIIWNGMLEAYADYCKTGRVMDLGSVKYDMLAKAKEIDLSNEEKRMIYRVAEMQVKKEQEADAFNNRLSYRQLQQMKDDKGYIISKSKEIALKNYFATKPDLESIRDKLYKNFMDEANKRK